MRVLYQKADRLGHDVIGAAIEVNRLKGPGLIESIYARCMLSELELRSIPSITQQLFGLNTRDSSSMNHCVLTSWWTIACSWN